eukprot:UN34587
MQSSTTVRPKFIITRITAKKTNLKETSKIRQLYLRALVKTRQEVLAETSFQEYVNNNEADLDIYNEMLTYYSQQRNIKSCLSLFKQLVKKNNIIPNSATLNCMIYVHNDNVDDALKWFYRVEELGVKLDRTHYTSLYNILLLERRF